MQNAIKTLSLIAVTGLAAAAPLVARATCWDATSQTYGIPIDVLKAVAKTESGFSPAAKHRNADGSIDHGMMQINSRWLPTLAQYGITESTLKDPCTNLKVGAWILANNAKKLGWNWNAIGAYNVGCAKLPSSECDRRRGEYAWKIHAALKSVGSVGGAGPQIAAAYDQGATALSNKIIHAAPQPAQTSKIMLVHVASNAVQPVYPAKEEAEEEPALLAMNIGAFLNYGEKVADDE